MSYRCIEVVRAYALTHIAAIYFAVEVEFVGQFSTIFNGEVGVASASINCAIERYCFAGTVANASVATHAIECAWLIGWKFYG